MAGEWIQELTTLAASLQTCTRNHCHRFRGGPRSCPWCDRAPKIGRDPYPPPPSAALLPGTWLGLELLSSDKENRPAGYSGQTPGDGRRTGKTARQTTGQDGHSAPLKDSAQRNRAWEAIGKIRKDDKPVTGTVIAAVKGGLILDIGVRGFLPASLVEMHGVGDLQPYVGRELQAKVIEMDKSRNNVVLSRRAWLEQAQYDTRQNFLSTLRKGQIRKGVVSSVVTFGAFVDLGTVEGFIHISELSWKHVRHPGEVVELGQQVTVEVLDIDIERERVSLSLKSTQEDPWLHFTRTCRIGQVIAARVVRLASFGAFVQVVEGVEGLVHISELANRRVEIPEQVVQAGEEVFAKIIDIDPERRRISLSLKQASDVPYK